MAFGKRGLQNEVPAGASTPALRESDTSKEFGAFQFLGLVWTNFKWGILGGIFALIAVVPFCNFQLAEFSHVEEAKSRVRSMLNDPDSAQFRNVHTKNDGSIAGEVNARNGFGGYVGFKCFLVTAAMAYVDHWMCKS
jgi:hypothetical protein